MAKISQETTELVRSATDIVDLIGSYIPVKRAGTRFVALCPFHGEKTPSFSINPQGQFFHCFGCGKSGDVITFVREYENLPFADAIRKLAGRAGIPVQEETLDPEENRARRTRGRLLDLHREVARFLHDLLLHSPEAKDARNYLRSRGFGREMAARWLVGYMPEKSETFLRWAREKNLNGRDLLASGLIGKAEDSGRTYVRFRDRLMFPVCNDHGDVIAFSGRQIHHNPNSGKYINSPEHPLFLKSHVIFGLDKARKAILKEQCALLCEGQLDAIACYEFGIENAIATLGTACTPHHARTLRRYTKKAILCFDADPAGFSAAKRAFAYLAAEALEIRAVRMPQGEDPDSFMRQHGADAFRQLLQQAPDYFDFIIDHAQSAQQLLNPEQRADFARDSAPLLAAIADPVSRDARINHVATRLRIGSPELRDAVAKALRKAKEKSSSPVEETSPGEASPEPARLDPIVGYLCSLALQSAATQNWLGEQFETLHDAAEFLPGIRILQTILAAHPDPSSHASVNAFLSSLPEPERLALYADPTFHRDLPADPLSAASEALAEVSAKALYRRDEYIKSQISRPDLTPQELVHFLQQAQEIAELLKGVDQRYVFNDRLAPSTKRFPRPENPPFPRRDTQRKP